jgi:hypothetical protein
MHAERDRFRNAKRPIDTFPRLVAIEHHNAGLTKEKSAHEILAHVPKSGQILYGIVSLKRTLGAGTF